MSSQNASFGHVIGVGALVIALPGGLLAWNQLTNSNSNDATPASEPDGADSTPDSDGDPPSSVPEPEGPDSTDEDPSESSPPSSSLDGCEIFVDHIGAEIRAEPQHLSLSLASVPSGTYAPLDTTVSNWAGQDQRWYELAVGDRIGWIVATPIFITSQTSSCP